MIQLALPEAINNQPFIKRQVVQQCQWFKMIKKCTNKKICA